MFYLLAVLAIASAISMILQRNPVMSAISLIGNFFCLAALYLMLRAQLLAVLQIVVYTGAIMVLVVFVIMLLNLGNEENLGERFNLKKTVGVALVCGFLLELVYIVVIGGNDLPLADVRGSAVSVGTVESMGTAMFGRFLLPFEVTSLLLLVAIVGAVILAKKRV
jgi:NADH-quinone oxidoreductase subunit J